jgi:DNA repair protein RadC
MEALLEQRLEGDPLGAGEALPSGAAPPEPPRNGRPPSSGSPGSGSPPTGGRGPEPGGEFAADGLARLSRMPAGELEVVLGLTARLARRLEAAFELGRRVELARRDPGEPLRTPAEVLALMAPRLRGLARETFHVLLLDGRHRLIEVRQVSEGTLTTSLVHPREVFLPALRRPAAAVLVVHNHPSGDPEPSPEDLEVTRRLAGCGRLVGIPLVDHVVVGEGCCVSIRSRIAF